MPSLPKKLKVGAVRYLNTKPLVHGLAGSADFDLLFDLPSRLADRLAAADLDVALIPTVEAFQNPEYTIISDACIACRGPVWSVKLFSRVPLAQIKSLALDEGSRTSVALVRILLNERFGIEPQLEPLPIGETTGNTQADAILLIGDRAIHPPAEKFTAVWDLGDQWCRWAELPFVFAMWTARPGVEVGSLGEALAAARDAGALQLEHIAAAEAAAVGLTPEECLHYFRDNLHFQLGERERQGLELFRKLSVQRGLAPDAAPLRFADCTTTS